MKTTVKFISIVLINSYEYYLHNFILKKFNYFKLQLKNHFSGELTTVSGIVLEKK